MPDDKSPSDIAPADNFSGALNSILSNPDMMSMISSMAKQLKSDSGSSEEKSENTTAQAAPQAPPQSNSDPSIATALSSLAPLLTGEGAKLSKRDNDRACLLRALKPYLSQDRGQAIDYIIKFSSLAEVLKNLS